ncbi:MAG TPA: SDR family oxidoreductase [Actinotalea caeni]|uniref:SDR family NAD(P)-dependent oxidoreductase n=1 Tax=Actinotalea caeni TaxID=1348467 RepID=UPI0012E12894|nr:SDR family oxidoreductase [Actinotalea caeni]HLV54693.1 SDR family oxidoreductase [Actinotalea caeni]
MTSSLAGRTALVTGASRGIGAAIARALDAAGARVLLAARSADALTEVAGTLRHDPVPLAVDLADADAVTDLAHRALDATGGRLDVLVNNAALARRVTLAETDAALIDAVLAVNVRAPLLLARDLEEALAASGHGSIVNITSVSGVVGTPRRAVYGASKAALDSITRSLAIDLGPRGIRVNAVAPGVVDTDLWARNKTIPEAVASTTALTPLGRWASPEDVADVVAWLASDAARFVTAQTVSADGGMAHTTDLYGGDV